MLRLNCEAKQYAWGQPGKQSLVAQLARCGSGLAIAADEPYAELWMGTHPSGPSTLMVSGRKLLDWIEDNMDALGPDILATFGPTLPFLFKILSVETALSIQSHPDKALAEQLHSERPEVYVDSNHKPEMAIAIRDFEALCGFATVGEISESIKQHPELRTCVGEKQAEEFLASQSLPEEQQTEVLKRTFTALMTCSPGVYKVATRRLHERLLAAHKALPLTGKDAVFMKVFREFPEDIGTMALFFLNYLCLHPGESIFLPANEPHAYLSGELLEAMASSDNVIRAGLTPKLRDTEVLCDSLTYKQGPPSPLQAVPISDNISVYKPPVEEFQILKFTTDREGVVVIPPQQSPMIFVVLQAEGVHSLQCTECPIDDSALESLVHLSPGLVLFVPAMTHLKLHSATMPGDDEDGPSNEPCHLLAYAATSNDRLFESHASEAGAKTLSAAVAEAQDA